MNISRVTKWVLAFRRLARPSTGIGISLMRQLYTAVTILKMVYVADIWYTPVYSMIRSKNRCGLVGFTCKMAMAQRLASMAIMVSLCIMVTDTLDAHANLLVVDLLLPNSATGWPFSWPPSWSHTP